MKVKRYLAGDVQEAMIKIRSELGRDAVILNTRKIKKPGIRGYFSKPLVEVVAAIDEVVKKPEPMVEKSIKENPQPLLKEVPKVTAAEKEKVENNVDTGEIEQLKKQMEAIKEMLNTVVHQMQNPSENKEEDHHSYMKLLNEHDISKDVSNRIIEVVSRQLSISDENEAAVKSAMRIIIKDLLGIPYTIENDEEKQKVFFFVGPTGVGKTTTLAKLAARLSLVDNRNVGLITADTYRIAAVEQLRTYSEILGVPLTVIYEADELNDALSEYRDKDFILIDTAGRSHKSVDLEADLSNLINKVETPEIFLVISLTTGYKDIISMMDSYKFLDDFKLLFTKLDEASTVGNILNVKVSSGKPLSYFTIGQSVPDDIEVADADKIANIIMGEIR